MKRAEKQGGIIIITRICAIPEEIACEGETPERIGVEWCGMEGIGRID